jgi:hypothetical protein
MPAAPPAPSIRSTHSGTYSWKHPVVARSRDVRLCASPRRMTRPEPAWHVLCVSPIFKRRHRLASLGCRVGGHHVLDAAATPVPTRNGILSPTARTKQRLGPENQRLLPPGATAQLRRPDDVASSNSNPLRPDENGVPASVALVTRLPYLLLVGLILRYIGVPFRFERGST